MNEFIGVGDRLKQYRNYSEELELLKLQIEEMERRVQTINSTSIIGKPEEGGIKKYLNDYVSELADLKTEYERRYAAGLGKMLDVRDYIDQLSDALEKRILFRYYCSETKIGLRKIAREFNYSYDYIREKHCSALKHLKELQQ